MISTLESANPGKRVLVVGANGYVGRALFEKAKLRFDALGTSSSGGDGLLPLRLGSANSFDFGQVDTSTTVLLTAAISAPDVCAREFDSAWAVNVTASSEFVTQVLHRGGRVIFFSSDTVYGQHEEPFDESASCSPAGEYAVMKHEVEQRFAGHSGFKAVRLSYVFSREDKFTRYLAGCARDNAEADLFHPFCRAIVHRNDVIDGALALVEQWNETPERIVNFGGAQVLSRVEFAECLRDAYLNDLRFKVTQPDESFFRNRPRVIAMTSPVLAKLLGRPLRSLFDAARLEFARPPNFERNV